MAGKSPSSLGRLQFGLSGLFLLTTLCAVLFAEMKSIGPAWIIILWIVLLPVFWLASRLARRDERGGRR